MSALQFIVLGASYIAGAIGTGLIRKMDRWVLLLVGVHLAAFTILVAAFRAMYP